MDVQKRFIKAGGLIDGSGDRVRRNVFLEIRDGVIAGIGPATELSAGKGAAVEDLSRCTIVVPLVDCSVFLARSPSVDPQVRAAADEAGLGEKTALTAQHVRYCYAHGVLGVAESDDPLGLVEHVREVSPEGQFVGIRKAGSDFLRIVYADILEDEGTANSRFGSEELSRILQQKGEKKAVVVANGEQQVRDALAAGCDAIEQGYEMGGENLRKMAELDVLWIPSVLTAQNGMLGSAGGGDVMCRFSMRYVAPGKADPGAEAFWKKLLAGQLEQLNRARELGVKTAIGTGAGRVGILHGESVVEEIKLFMKAGWPLEEAVRSGSVNGARFFGFENIGEVAVGRPATFLVARGTVQQLPRKLAFLENVYVEGKAGF